MRVTTPLGAYIRVSLGVWALFACCIVPHSIVFVIALGARGASAGCALQFIRRLEVKLAWAYGILERVRAVSAIFATVTLAMACCFIDYHLSNGVSFSKATHRHIVIAAFSSSMLLLRSQTADLSVDGALAALAAIAFRFIATEASRALHPNISSNFKERL
jgi:hypothetical protein